MSLAMLVPQIKGMIQSVNAEIGHFDTLANQSYLNKAIETLNERRASDFVDQAVPSQATVLGGQAGAGGYPPFSGDEEIRQLEGQQEGFEPDRELDISPVGGIQPDREVQEVMGQGEGVAPSGLDLTFEQEGVAPDTEIKQLITAPVSSKPEDFDTAEEYVESNATFVHETDADEFDEFKSGVGIKNTIGDNWLGDGVYLQQKGSFKMEQYGKNKSRGWFN